MKYTERLLEENKKLWDSYLTHPFIVGMKEGTLDIEAFKYYMIQDYLYLLEYTKVFALGISKTNNNEDIKKLSDSISAISWEIDNVHMKYMERIGITTKEVEEAKASLSNLGYTSYMIAKANENDVINAYIAVLSCSWSYAYIGKILKENNPEMLENNTFGEWVEAYSSDEYQTENNNLMDIVNERCKNLSEERLNELSEIFRICSLFELRFWDMAYTMGESDISRF